MAESAYHNEALRRTRVIQRKNEAVQRKMNDCKGISQTPVDVKRNTNILFSGQLDFDTNRQGLPKFRVNQEGFNNRYRSRDNHDPHVDLAYAVIYPGEDNSDYTCDENRNNRRFNKKVDYYNVVKKVNGEFHTKVLKESTKSDH